MKFLVVALVLFQVANLALVAKVDSKQPGTTTTTVYHRDAAIPGPIGATGAQGINGINGNDGSDGKAGQNGQSGILTQLQTITVQGEPGLPGVPGKDGVNGVDGRGVSIYKQNNGDIVRQYDGDDTATVLLSKCDYAPSSEGCDAGN